MPNRDSPGAKTPTHLLTFFLLLVPPPRTFVLCPLSPICSHLLSPSPFFLWDDHPLFPKLGGTGLLAGTVSCACSFFTSTLFLLGPETLDSSPMRCPVFAGTCTYGPFFNDPIVLPCHWVQRL